MFTTRPEIVGTFGAVASTHWLASQVGMAVLERGGNAFDAAAAAGFALQVAEPHMNGPGGEVPILLHDARADRQHVICGQGVAPAAATLAGFESLGLDLVPGTGLLPAMVPGAFDAWCLLLRDWGTWELADILAFAIDYARNGVPLVADAAAAIDGVRPLFETAWPSSAAVFLPHGRVPASGALFANPVLADTYARLAAAPGATRRSTASRPMPKSSIPRADGTRACFAPTTWRAGQLRSRHRCAMPIAATKC
jgi:gamma-glutamyltranspeptidase/glutathione hydrolase